MMYDFNYYYYITSIIIMDEYEVIRFVFQILVRMYQLGITISISITRRAQNTVHQVQLPTITITYNYNLQNAHFKVKGPVES